MVDIRVRCETTAPPEAVLGTLRGRSGEERHRYWTNVKPRYFTLHDSGPDFVEVTEGTFIAGLFWERSRYDWSQPGRVEAIVLDSNVFKPGSSFELAARRSKDDTTLVEMTIQREFQPSPKGRIAAAVNHGVGGPAFRSYLRRVVRTVEEETG